MIKAAVCSFQTEWPSMEPEGTSCSSVASSYSFPGSFKSEVVAGKGWNFNLWCLLTRGVSFCRFEQTEKPPWVRPFAGCWEGSRGGWAGLLGSRDKSLVGKTRQGSRKYLFQVERLTNLRKEQRRCTGKWVPRSPCPAGSMDRKTV